MVSIYPRNKKMSPRVGGHHHPVHPAHQLRRHHYNNPNRNTGSSGRKCLFVTVALGVACLVFMTLGGTTSTKDYALLSVETQSDAQHHNQHESHSHHNQQQDPKLRATPKQQLPQAHERMELKKNSDVQDMVATDEFEEGSTEEGEKSKQDSQEENENENEDAEDNDNNDNENGDSEDGNGNDEEEEDKDDSQENVEESLQEEAPLDSMEDGEAPENSKEDREAPLDSQQNSDEQGEEEEQEGEQERKADSQDDGAGASEDNEDNNNDEDEGTQKLSEEEDDEEGETEKQSDEDGDAPEIKKKSQEDEEEEGDENEIKQESLEENDGETTPEDSKENDGEEETKEKNEEDEDEDAPENSTEGGAAAGTKQAPEDVAEATRYSNKNGEAPEDSKQTEEESDNEDGDGVDDKNHENNSEAPDEAEDDEEKSDRKNADVEENGDEDGKGERPKDGDTQSSLASSLSTNIRNNVKSNDGEKPVVVAHVVSLIKCAKEAAVTGFLDAAAVLRHSIHKTSVHALDPATGKPMSKYSYQMYAIVHAEGCAPHAPLLEGLGYKTLVKHNPVNQSDIIGEGYKRWVKWENCCGLEEFIKLYAYTLFDHPISVHWDLDVAILQPLDELYDSMLYDKDSPEGKAAREKVVVAHPQEALPDVIDAYYTKDVTSSQPWEIRQGVQGGFLMARPSQEIFDMYVQFITLGNYTKGRGNGKGWAGLGFGGFQGAMAYQGAAAYLYDILYPNRAVPLNPCVYNQVVADVIWRGPNGMEYENQCREYPRPPYVFANNTIEHGACEDCRVFPVEKTKSAHYTACKKPWECLDPNPRVPRDKRHVYRLSQLTNKSTCYELFAKWFGLRNEFETLLEEATKGEVKQPKHNGDYLPNAFLGYCERPGGYIPMVPPPEGFDITKIYGM